MTGQKKSKWRTLKKGIRVFFTVLLVLSLCLLLYLLVGSKSKQLPFLRDYHIYTVISGSMEPNVPVGSVVVVKEQPPQTLQEGDVISFYSNDPMMAGQIVSHRIQTVLNQDILMFITKGDANPAQDPAAALGENVIGRVVYCVPYLGYLLSFLSTRKGIFLVAILPCAVILILEVIGLIRNISSYVDEKNRASGDSQSKQEIQPEEHNL